MSLGAKSRRRRRPKAGAGGHLPPRAFAPAPSQLPDAALSPVGRRTFLLRRPAHVQAAEAGRSVVRRHVHFGLEFQFVETVKQAEQQFAFRGLHAGEQLLLESQRQRRDLRSEEHTSELQSLMRISYAVFCLTKKKNDKRT